MRIAYLVFAYKNPRLLKKTIESLSSKDSTFYIHIDAKRDLSAFQAIRGDNVHLTHKRIRVYWAEFSGVEAILLLMRQALSAADRHDYLVLLSGSEYPIKSRQYIEGFFAANRGAEFMSIVKMPAPGKPISRIDTLRFPSTRPVQRLIFRGLNKVALGQRDHRKHLGSLAPYSGHTWWALTKEACQHILDFQERNPIVVRFFENAYAPEETFFHTILGNSPFRERMRRNLVYEDWSANGAHPAMITERHVTLFESQEKVCVQDLYGPGELLFARKFSDDNLQLTERIDEMISRNEQAGSEFYTSVA